MDLGRIHWYGHDAFRVEDAGKQIYIDPWQMPDGLPKADYILITHGHHDHYSPGDVKKLSQAGTRLVAPADLAAKIGQTATAIAPGETLALDALKVKALPAYNLNKDFHPRRNNWVGYVLTLSDGSTVYHAGDTDHVPEMNGLKVDVALVPVSGTYVMTAAEAAGAAGAMQPAAVIPMHYGTIVGTPNDAEKFKKAFRGQTVIKQPER